MKETMRPDERVKSRLYEQIETNQRSTVIKRPWLPAVAAACVLALMIAVIYPIISRDGEHQVFESNNRGDTRMIQDYIDMNAQLWGKIVAGLEIGDFSGWNEWNRYHRMTQTVPPLQNARRQLDYWHSAKASDFKIYKDFGTYNKNRVVSFIQKDGMMVDILSFVDVGGYRFTSDGGLEILVYTPEGYFFDIRDTELTGRLLLSSADLAAIYDKHFKDNQNAHAPGEWEIDVLPDENYRELKWVTTLRGNTLSIYYNLSDFTDVIFPDYQLFEQNVRDAVMSIADLMTDYIMLYDPGDITAVMSVFISKYCDFDDIDTGDVNSFFVRPGLQHESGMQSLGERVTVNRTDNGSFVIGSGTFDTTLPHSVEVYRERLMGFMERYSASKVTETVEVHNHLYWSNDKAHYEQFADFFLSLDLIAGGSFQAAMTGCEEMYTAMVKDAEDSDNNVVIWVMKNMTDSFSPAGKKYNYISLYGTEIDYDNTLSAVLSDEEYDWFVNWAQVFEDMR